MRIPRSVSASELIKLLRKQYEYVPVRQSGSHIRCVTQKNGEHHLTIPNHDPIKIGTLSSILNDVADHFLKTKEEVINELFG
ncbi:MAG: type II toxin-antitoxin system HicA family toxin [Chitinophagales bacterium]|nr:type II toxin-antitoxin system HicA family toxin [Chitinophagales bacterium]